MRDELLLKRFLVFSNRRAKEKGHTIAHIPTYTHQPLNTNTIANHFTELNHTIDYITTHSQKGLLHLLTCIKQEQLMCY